MALLVPVIGDTEQAVPKDQREQSRRRRLLVVLLLLPVGWAARRGCDQAPENADVTALDENGRQIDGPGRAPSRLPLPLRAADG
jgi:hypothetical protein